MTRRECSELIIGFCSRLSTVGPSSLLLVSSLRYEETRRSRELRIYGRNATKGKSLLLHVRGR
jgi:hypothetical protein